MYNVRINIIIIIIIIILYTMYYSACDVSIKLLDANQSTTHNTPGSPTAAATRGTEDYFADPLKCKDMQIVL